MISRVRILVSLGGVLLCLALLWLLMYRPLYRSPWRGAQQTYGSAADLSLGSRTS